MKEGMWGMNHIGHRKNRKQDKTAYQQGLPKLWASQAFSFLIIFAISSESYPPSWFPWWI